MPEVFQDIRVTLIRPERVDPDGLCGDFNPQDDFKNVALQPGIQTCLLQTFLDLLLLLLILDL